MNNTQIANFELANRRVNRHEQYSRCDDDKDHNIMLMCESFKTTGVKPADRVRLVELNETLS